MSGLAESGADVDEWPVRVVVGVHRTILSVRRRERGRHGSGGRGGIGARGSAGGRHCGTPATWEGAPRDAGTAGRRHRGTPGPTRWGIRRARLRHGAMAHYRPERRRCSSAGFPSLKKSPLSNRSLRRTFDLMLDVACDSELKAATAPSDDDANDWVFPGP